MTILTQRQSEIAQNKSGFYLSFFEGDKEYFLALQSSEKNGEGGELSREVHDGCKKDQSH